MAELSQNIFDYATSELSQDAFISLLIAWFDSPDKNLRNISTDFISSLYREYVIRKFRWSASEKDFIYSQYKKHELDMKIEIKSVEIKQQHFKIDVYFEVKDISGKKIIPFIVEDKTWTEPHSDQLKEYVQKVCDDKNCDAHDIVKIFFKTGHITEKDKELTKNIETKNEKMEDANYVIIDTLWIYNFLERHNPDHAIYKDYKDYLKRNFYDKLYDKGIKKELKDWKYNDLKEGYVQYALIEKIKHLVLGDTKPVARYIKFTRNGKRWDTWWSRKGNGIADKYSILAKVTKLKEGHCIRLLDYSNSLAGKENRMKKHREIVKCILESNDYKNIKISTKLGDKVKESAVAIMNLKNISSLEDAAIEFSNFMKEYDAKC